MDLKFTHVGHEQLIPNHCSLPEFNSLNSRAVGRAWVNVSATREKVLERLGGIFLPKKDQLLSQWKDDGLKCSHGDCLEVNNFMNHKSNR